MEQVRELVSQMEAYVVEAVGRKELHELEHGLFRRLRELGQVMLERFVAESGTGYTAGQSLCTLADEPLTYKEIETVRYLSIFGSVELPRAAYARPDGGYEYPMKMKRRRDKCPSPREPTGGTDNLPPSTFWALPSTGDFPRREPSSPS